MSFPLSPTNGQTYKDKKGITYIFNNGGWLLQSTGSALIGGDIFKYNTFSVIGTDVTMFPVLVTGVGTGVTVSSGVLTLQAGTWALSASLSVPDNGFTGTDGYIQYIWQQVTPVQSVGNVAFIHAASTLQRNTSSQPIAHAIVTVTTPTQFRLQMLQAVSTASVSINSSRSTITVERIVAAPISAAQPPKVTTFTNTSTWTPDPLAIYYEVQCVGAGGSGGVNSNSIANQGAIACSAGGSGGYAKVRVTRAQIGATSRTVTINTSTGVSSIQGIVSCTKGANGDQTASSGPGVSAVNGGVSGSFTVDIGTLLDSTASHGDGTIAGNYTDQSSNARIYFVDVGAGGSNPLGRGGRSRVGGGSTILTLNPGEDGAGFGSGGGGAGAAVGLGNTTTGATGGAGRPGAVIVTEYYQ